MYVNQIAEALDGWTRLRVQRYVDDDGEYETVFDSDDHCGWVGVLPDEDCAYKGVGDWEVTQIALEDDHIVLRCDYTEEDE